MKKCILDLKPTQFSLGFKDVDNKIDRIKKHGHDATKKVPVVAGPDGLLYIIDHHHFVRAMWECGHHHVEVDIVANYSHLSEKKFWSKMKKMKYVFLLDAFGKGPHSPYDLPSSIRCMSDNPYRSLAWILREAGAFNKSTVPFAEFYWAQLLRKNLKATDIFSSNALQKATKICRTKGKKLPGFKK